MDVIRKTVETQYMLSTAFEIVFKPDDVSEIMLALLRRYMTVNRGKQFLWNAFLWLIRDKGDGVRTGEGGSGMRRMDENASIGYAGRHSLAYTFTRSPRRTVEMI